MTPDPPVVYSPSPRPTFDRPTAITHAAATRYVWGDPGAGEVADLIYASTGSIHALVFGLGVGGRFTHSREFRTVFGADELLHVLSGTMVLANPETGQVVKVPAGGRATFGKDTWHHAFAHGGEPLRVLELFAPPPSAGTSGAYARTRPFLEESVYTGFPEHDAVAPGALRVVRDADTIWRRDLGVLSGVLLSTDQITVHTLEINPGEVAAPHTHGGDEVVYVLGGTLWVRAWFDDASSVFELHQDDACFIPAGSRHEYRNYDATVANAIVGVAPRYATRPIRPSCTPSEPVRQH